VRDHRDTWGIAPIVLRQDGPAERRADAEHLEVVAGDDLPHRQPGPPFKVQRGEHGAVADDVLEDVVLGFEVEVIRIRRGAEARRASTGEDVDEPLGRRHRQRFEEQRVDDREQRGIEADADCQRCHRNQREAGAFPQPAQRVANIGNQRFEQAL
jgi:hypothetical protein